MTVQDQVRDIINAAPDVIPEHRKPDEREIDALMHTARVEQNTTLANLLYVWEEASPAVRDTLGVSVRVLNGEGYIFDGADDYKTIASFRLTKKAPVLNWVRSIDDLRRFDEIITTCLKEDS